jgi:hypothetical protein
METVQPDVIIGTETWLTKDIGNGEIFPAELGFDVIRRDREGDAHGGVLIASNSEYGLTQVNVSKESEMITGSIKLGNKQHLSRTKMVTYTVTQYPK